MLTRTTKKTGGKQLLIAPILLISMLCFTNNAFPWQPEPRRDGNKVTYQGNVFEYPEDGRSDTVMVQDAQTGEMQMLVTRREPAFPSKMNGEKIYHSGDFQNNRSATTHESNLNSQALKEYLLSNMGDEIENLEDGAYRLLINGIVIGEEGNVVYFEFESIERLKQPIGGKQEFTMLDDYTNEVFARKVAKLIDNAPAHSPAIFDGKSVPSAISNTEFWNTFSVKGGQLISL